jgi:hypothetical protein
MQKTYPAYSNMMKGVMTGYNVEVGVGAALKIATWSPGQLYFTWYHQFVAELFLQLPVL